MHRIQSAWGKIRTKKNSDYIQFLRSVCFYVFKNSDSIITVGIWCRIISVASNIFFFNEEEKIADTNVKEKKA